MTRDPVRLMARDNSLEALLVERLDDVDPPDGAEAEVWRRTQQAIAAAGALGVAGAVALHGSQAAQVGAAGAGAGGTGVVSTALGKLLSLVGAKWVAVGVVVASTAGVATHWVVQGTGSSTPPGDVSGPGTLPPGTPLQVTGATLAPDAVEDPQSELGGAESRAAAESSTQARASGVLREGASAQSAPSRSRLEAESALLGQARAKLRSGDGAGALADVERLRAEFPNGLLVQERELVAIEALKLRGRNDAAGKRAAAFVDEFPDSPYTGRVQAEVPAGSSPPESP